MVYIVDDGKAVVGQAARTHPDYRHRGLMYKLFDYNADRIAKSGKYPDIQKTYGVTLNASVVLTNPSRKDDIVLARVIPDSLLFGYKVIDSF